MLDFKVLMNGFEMPIMIYGTEEDVVSYANSELKSWDKYSGATSVEVDAYKALGGKIYMA